MPRRRKPQSVESAVATTKPATAVAAAAAAVAAADLPSEQLDKVRLALAEMAACHAQTVAAAGVVERAGIVILR